MFICITCILGGTEKLAGAVEYDNSISAGVTSHQTSVLDVTLNNLMVNVEYPFIAITPRSTHVWGSSSWKGLMNGSNRTVWSFDCV